MPANADTERPWREWVKRDPQLSEADLAQQRKAPLILTDYQRVTLAKTFDHYADEMRRLIDERGENGHLTQERAVWMADQVDAWYELADAIRNEADDPMRESSGWGPVIERIVGPSPTDKALAEAAWWLGVVLTALADCGYRLSPTTRSEM